MHSTDCNESCIMPPKLEVPSRSLEWPVRSTVLENGLVVIAQEVRAAPLASVWCWYRVGSKDEPPGLTGVSHWVVHMNFKGTANITREDMTGIIGAARWDLERLHLDRPDDLHGDGGESCA